MMKIPYGLLAGLVCFSLQVAQAADLDAGRKKSATCAACHGAVGISTNTDWPNLANQQVAYLVKQMKAFRGGERSDPWMSPMAKSLSDEDIADLAAFYNSLPVRDEYQ
jgi:cytochrome c553